MDEQTLFDRFHEALNMEPRPGAYERMRFALTNSPVVLKKRPAHPMRWPKMGLRVAAVLTAVVILIAFIAAFLASHHAVVGSVPAGQDPSVKAYQAMLKSEYGAMNAATSNNCNTIDDTGCLAALNKVTPALQHWVDHLGSTQTPSGFVVLDGQLRRHLNQAIKDLTAVGAYQRANNQKGFDFARSAAVYERAWIDPATFALEGTYPKVAGSYQDAVNLARQALEACINSTPAPADLACAHLSQQQTCAGAETRCETDVQAADTWLQTFLVGLTQNPAPSALATKGAKLLADLAQADTALLGITDALLSGDSAKADLGQGSFTTAILAAGADFSYM